MDIDTSSANIPAFVAIGSLPLGRGAYFNGDMHVVIGLAADGATQVRTMRLRDFTPVSVDAATVVLSRKVVAVVSDVA